MSEQPLIALPSQPVWSDTVTHLDDGREFSAELGSIEPADAATCLVELVQTEHIDWDADIATVHRAAPQLRIKGFRYSLDQAATLADLIEAALSAVPGDG